MQHDASAQLIAVRDELRFDEEALQRYLTDQLDGFSDDLEVRQFDAGQSNPTFQVTSGGTTYVLRKKPPGDLLPSAHAVDREYRVMAALKGTSVPVPKVLHLCMDRSIIGTEFYVMEMVEGRVFHDPSLPGLSAAQRKTFYDSFIRALAALHTIEPASVGLEDFGRPDGFIARQVSRWSKQYRASQTETIEAMDQLIAWLPDHIPQDHAASIVHGDYRPGNVIAGTGEPEVIALLDWELCTLGHPLADLGYCCANYYAQSLPTGQFSGLDFAALGIPTEAEFVELYCRYSGRSQVDDYLFYVVFSFFRSAAIIQGVYKRGLEGNASSHRATELGHMARLRSETAWKIVQEHFT